MEGYGPPVPRQGSLRYAFHMVDDRNERFVAKSRIVAPASNKEYFEGVAMQVWPRCTPPPGSLCLNKQNLGRAVWEGLVGRGGGG